MLLPHRGKWALNGGVHSHKMMSAGSALAMDVSAGLSRDRHYPLYWRGMKRCSGTNISKIEIFVAVTTIFPQPQQTVYHHESQQYPILVR